MKWTGWLEEARQQIREIADMPPGWDHSQIAVSPDSDKLEAACKLLLQLCQASGGQLPKPFIFPMLSGGVQLVWGEEPRCLEIVFESVGDPYYCWYDKKAGGESDPLIDSDYVTDDNLVHIVNFARLAGAGARS